MGMSFGLGPPKRDKSVSKDERIEVITHLAFYSGWPTANSALPIARRVFQENP